MYGSLQPGQFTFFIMLGLICDSVLASSAIFLFIVPRLDFRFSFLNFSSARASSFTLLGVLESIAEFYPTPNSDFCPIYPVTLKKNLLLYAAILETLPLSFQRLDI